MKSRCDVANGNDFAGFISNGCDFVGFFQWLTSSAHAAEIQEPPDVLHTAWPTKANKKPLVIVDLFATDVILRALFETDGILWVYLRRMVFVSFICERWDFVGFIWDGWDFMGFFATDEILWALFATDFVGFICRGWYFLGFFHDLPPPFL